MASKTNRTLLIGGLIGLLLLGTGGAAMASEPEPDDLPPAPPPPKPDPEEYGENWGAFPEALRGPFLAAEKAARLPGLARFMAVWSWGAFRAHKPFVSPEEAAVIAAANPSLCSACQNLNDAKWSRQALERVTLPISEGGAYKKPWPKPANFDAWADFGSAGLFDMLAGSVAHLGIHEQFIPPYLSDPPTVLFELRPQLYYAGVFVHRVFNSPLYKVLTNNPAETWARVRAVTSSPKQFLAWQGGDTENEIATTAMANFVGRAKEIGIVLTKMANPTITDVKAWPGAEAYFAAIEGSSHELLECLTVPLWPLLSKPKSWTSGGSFGASRDGGDRKHQGIDLYAPKGAAVIALEDGVITGSQGWSGSGTKGLWVDHPKLGATILYGAVAPGTYAAAGTPVKRGRRSRRSASTPKGRRCFTLRLGSWAPSSLAPPGKPGTLRPRIWISAPISRRQNPTSSRRTPTARRTSAVGM
ncbi:MAG: M23 family metallopeptidase [Bacteroidia bacterium]